MAQVAVHRDDVELDEPTFVDGLPGVGLVGKIAADHLVDSFDMTEYGTVHCDGLPEVAVFQDGEQQYRPPVRIYADAERDLLVLGSDAPVSPNSADEFAGCLCDWLADRDATPLFLSGLGGEKDGVPEMYGVASDGAAGLLDDYGIDPPTQDGVITGPTGALLYRAQRVDLPALGLVVEANQNFPDPEAARVLLLDGIGPIADVSIDTDRLVEQAEEISEARQQLAQRMQEAGEESTSARPMGMYQ
ncbi:3-isopropylmalate dehydratase [Halobacteriales archaeon QH_10_67_22]|nr:MAG: 3-isopropylmalate dehydratase [Halobacteriales archaeon QH_10_67_22]